MKLMNWAMGRAWMGGPHLPDAGEHGAEPEPGWAWAAPSSLKTRA